MNDWDIIDLHFKDHKYPFTNHHLDSYRELIKTFIPQTIKSYNPITMIKFGESENDEAVKVEVYIGGLGDTLRIYVDRPTSFDEDGKYGDLVTNIIVAIDLPDISGMTNVNGRIIGYCNGIGNAIAENIYLRSIT